MARLGRPRLENPMQHMAVLLPPELIDLLKASAAANRTTVSQEIRDRLWQAYNRQTRPNQFTVYKELKLPRR